MEAVKYAGGVMVLAPAKLNITLDIGEKDPAGMHFVSSIMQTVSLYDHITVAPIRRGQERMEGSFMADNLLPKVVDEMSREAGGRLSCTVACHKTIPIAAGMGEAALTRRRLCVP